MAIDRNDCTNSELEELGLPLDDFDDFDEPDDDFDVDTSVFHNDEWVADYDILVDNLYYRDIA